MKEFKGSFDAKGKKFAIVASRFNELLSQRLVEAALDCLTRHGSRTEDVELFWTPGAFEIPLVAMKLAKSRAYDAVIALGAVVRGGTPHFEYIASQSAKGIAEVNLETGVPVSFGIITADTLEQALERAGTKAGNKGFDAAISAIEMANLVGQIDRKKK
ncbi:MAG: 6,7-dimethyl-8-ribityllumazine synthase [Candidatus Eisenbacteria bacterium]|nr:6,7-dimethyl-8-ribityllumazine synthase [Candidatus Eisenbacteria bacterium]